MMDFAVRPDIRVKSIGMLHVPVEIFYAPAGMRMRNPFIPVRIQISVLGSARRVL